MIAPQNRFRDAGGLKNRELCRIEGKQSAVRLNRPRDMDRLPIAVREIE